jgi:hypothetical protein
VECCGGRIFYHSKERRSSYSPDLVPRPECSDPPILYPRQNGLQEPCSGRRTGQVGVERPCGPCGATSHGQSRDERQPRCSVLRDPPPSRASPGPKSAGMTMRRFGPEEEGSGTRPSRRRYSADENLPFGGRCSLVGTIRKTVLGTRSRRGRVCLSCTSCRTREGAAGAGHAETF